MPKPHPHASLDDRLHHLAPQPPPSPQPSSPPPAPPLSSPDPTDSRPNSSDPTRMPPSTMTPAPRPHQPTPHRRLTSDPPSPAPLLRSAAPISSPQPQPASPPFSGAAPANRTPTTSLPPTPLAAPASLPVDAVNRCAAPLSAVMHVSAAVVHRSAPFISSPCHAPSAAPNSRSSSSRRHSIPRISPSTHRAQRQTMDSKRWRRRLVVRSRDLVGKIPLAFVLF